METLDAPRRTWRAVVWLIGALPHALPMWWVVSAAMSAPTDQRNAPLVLLVEIPVSIIVFVLAGDFRGRRGWIRTILRTATVLGASVVVGSALWVGADP